MINEKISYKNPYFDLLAEIGITSHPGGFKSTEKLIQSCGINKESRILDVGTGSGTTSCYLAKNFGCNVYGIDISRKMIDKAKSRAEKEGIGDFIVFDVSDAGKLHFEDNFFDLVIIESVLSFMDDKSPVLRELLRVTRKGGYIGINEAMFINKVTINEFNNILSIFIGGVKLETPSEWMDLLTNLGLEMKVFDFQKVNFINQIYYGIKSNGPLNLLRSVYKLAEIYLTDPRYRQFLEDLIVIDLREIPVILKIILIYAGYGIYVGRKI
ncbi:MAG: class I SAM-dependent methyltransferase [Methanobacterium sp.]